MLRCWRESFDLSFCFLVSLRGGGGWWGGSAGGERGGGWGVSCGVVRGGEWEVGNGGLGDGMGVSEERARMVSMVGFDFRCIK